MSLRASALWATALLLLAIIAAELSLSNPKQAGPATAGASADPSPARVTNDAVGLRPPSEWAATALSRPLFAPGRRSYEPTTKDGSEPSLPRLSGVLVSPSDRVAIFAADASHETLAIRVGSAIGGHQVQSVDPGQVVVLDNGGPRILRPTFYSPLQPAKTAPPIVMSRARPTDGAITALERRAALRGMASLREDGALQAAEGQSAP